MVNVLLRDIDDLVGDVVDIVEAEPGLHPRYFRVRRLVSIQDVMMLVNTDEPFRSSCGVMEFEKTLDRGISVAYGGRRYYNARLSYMKVRDICNLSFLGCSNDAHLALSIVARLENNFLFDTIG